MILIGAAGLFVFVTVLTLALDRTSLRASEQIMAANVDDRMRLLEKLTLEYAYWDEAAANLVDTVDFDWISATFEDYSKTTLNIDAIHVVDGSNTAKAHVVDDAIADVDLSDRYGPSVLKTLDAARVSEDQQVPVPITGFVEQGARYYLISAARITSYDSEKTIPTDHVIMLTQNVGEEFLAELGQRYHLPGLQVSRDPSKLWQGGIPILGSDGTQIGYFVWSPELAGFKLRPALAVGILGLGIIVLIAARVFTKRATQIVHELDLARREAVAVRSLLEDQARRDPLTDLGNRRLLDTVLGDMEDARPPDPPHALLSIDLDGFKEINDAFGHETGDQVLQHVGKILLTLAPHDDQAFRLGGDEFVIIFKSAQREHVEAVGSLIVERLSKPVSVNGYNCKFGASVGIAFSRNPGDLLRNADVALYSAKRCGRGRTSVYSHALMDLREDPQLLAQQT